VDPDDPSAGRRDVAQRMTMEELLDGVCWLPNAPPHTDLHVRPAAVAKHRHKAVAEHSIQSPLT
jgi:hypothetical protein